jgi:RimJ/RimL family protein N-acetyltransferase
LPAGAEKFPGPEKSQAAKRAQEDGRQAHAALVVEHVRALYNPRMTPPPGLVFRTWRASDVGALCRHANNRRVWLNLKDRFPHPYTPDDAERWIDLNHATLSAPLNFAIELEGEAIGGVGVARREDVFHRTGEIGYWVAEPFWGKGIATAAAHFITEYAFATFKVVRLQAGVFDWNPASARVLEKCGYVQEARLRQAVTKEERTGDLLMYARLR